MSQVPMRLPSRGFVQVSERTNGSGKRQDDLSEILPQFENSVGLSRLFERDNRVNFRRHSPPHKVWKPLLSKPPRNRPLVLNGAVSKCETHQLETSCEHLTKRKRNLWSTKVPNKDHSPGRCQCLKTPGKVWFSNEVFNNVYPPLPGLVHENLDKILLPVVDPPAPTEPFCPIYLLLRSGSKPDLRTRYPCHLYRRSTNATSGCAICFDHGCRGRPVPPVRNRNRHSPVHGNKFRITTAPHEAKHPVAKLRTGCGCPQFHDFAGHLESQYSVISGRKRVLSFPNEDIGTVHAHCPNPDQHFIRPEVRYRSFNDSKNLAATSSCNVKGSHELTPFLWMGPHDVTVTEPDLRPHVGANGSCSLFEATHILVSLSPCKHNSRTGLVHAVSTRAK